MDQSKQSQENFSLRTPSSNLSRSGICREQKEISLAMDDPKLNKKV